MEAKAGDDYAGYKASLTQGITEIGCAAHARRKFFDLHTSPKSAVAEQALKFFGDLYEIERGVRDLSTDQRLEIRQQKARPVADALHAWMIAHRLWATDGTALAHALNYSLKRWAALTRYIDDGQLPIATTWWRTRSGRSRSDGLTGCSRVRCGPGSARPR